MNDQQHPDEFRWWIKNFVKGKQSLLEIGSSEGLSLYEMALAMAPGAKIRSIDLGEIHYTGNRKVDPQRAILNTVKVLKAKGYDAAAWFGDSRSPDAVEWAVQNGPYDVVFIDGDHTFEGVASDWLNYGPMGKIVGLHDIGHPEEDGPRRLWTKLTRTRLGNMQFHSIKHGSGWGIGVALVEKEMEGEPGHRRKLNFDSTHRRAFDLVEPYSKVLDLGCESGWVGAALKTDKKCYVAGVDQQTGLMAPVVYDTFAVADLNKEMTLPQNHWVLALDVIEHLYDPVQFLRNIAASQPRRMILTTPNIAFIGMRIGLLFGRFNYRAAGILDSAHLKFWTFASLRRLLDAHGFVIERMEGIPPPIPLLLKGGEGVVLMWIARQLARWLPRVFGYQILVVAR